MFLAVYNDKKVINFKSSNRKSVIFVIDDLFQISKNQISQKTVTRLFGNRKFGT